MLREKEKRKKDDDEDAFFPVTGNCQMHLVVVKEKADNFIYRREKKSKQLAVLPPYFNMTPKFTMISQLCSLAEQKLQITNTNIAIL